MPIDTKATIQRSTPAAFRPEETNATVAMLPLVRDTKRHWPAGWCSYTDGFEENPDIEVFCGGENEKTARGAACWRQGNLLHFGFEQSPADLNEAGQALLLNCIAYISQFTEDRPIAVTPSVFAGPVAYPRAYLDRRLGRDGDAGDMSWLLDAKLIEQLKNQSRDEVRRWYAAHRGYLHPGKDLKLEIDQDAEKSGALIDQAQFFERAIAALGGGSEEVKRATTLLDRYAPLDAPDNDSPKSWQEWFKANRPYLFFSDEGDYHWYVDPLAKKRGIPSSQLRGIARASSKTPGQSLSASSR